MKMYGTLLSTMLEVTIDQGDLIRNVITSWNENLLDVDHLMHSNWVAYFRTMPPRSLHRKGSDMPRPIQCAKLTKATARHTKIRDQNPSLGNICPREPHERSSNAPKFEDRSQEETVWQNKVPAKQRGKLPKEYFLKRSETEQHSSHFRKEVPTCIKS